MSQPPSGSSIHVPFDDGVGRYEFEVYPDQIELGDAVVLALDREACRSFASIFQQLAEGDYPEGYHLHLGWNEQVAFAPGLRLVLTETGRLTGEAP